MLKYQLALVGALLCLTAPALADVPQVIYVTSCGTLSKNPGTPGPLYATTTGQLCISGTISATINAWAPGGAYLNVASVTTGSANGALPAGSNVVVYNYGANPIMVKLSTSGATTVTAATADAIIQPSSAQELSVGTNTRIAYATTLSTSSMQVSGGAGIAAGWGGGGGSSGGGGGTSAADKSTWTVSSTLQTPIGCEYTSGGATALTTGQMGTVGCTTGRGLFVNIDSLGGTGSFTAYGSTPGAVPALPVDAFVSNTNANGSATSANSSPVVLASDQTVADPCMYQAKLSSPIEVNATAATQIVAASASKKIYICSITIVAAGASTVSLLTGTGTNCGTATAAVMGSTTAANGMSFSASGGIVAGNGSSTVTYANVAGAELCTLQTAAVYLSGYVSYIQQ